jgi:hypothetical protein
MAWTNFRVADDPGAINTQVGVYWPRALSLGISATSPQVKYNSHGAPRGPDCLVSIGRLHSLKKSI